MHARLIVGARAEFVFASDVIATGLLVIPIHAASAAYVVSETCKLHVALARRSLDAKAFYAALSLTTVVETALNSQHRTRLRHLSVSPSTT